MVDIISERACFGGVLRICRHEAAAIGLPMRFAVYLPPQATPGARLPLLIYLAGLTCNEETFMMKGGAQRMAAQLGVMLVAPDTSPREAHVDGETADWDFGIGAGFYLDATQPPWQMNYRMESYIHELRELACDAVRSGLPGDAGRVGIFGHSMGGHGALTLALRRPDLFRSVSAFAPIAAPMRCPWGRKAFRGYLGNDESKWAQHDASALMEGLHKPFPNGILIDQGMADQFLDEQLYPEVFEAACERAGQPLELRRHHGYDHGYYFISSFMEDHLRFHAERL